MAQMPVVEEGAEPPPYFPRTLVTQSVGTIIVGRLTLIVPTLRVVTPLGTLCVRG